MTDLPPSSAAHPGSRVESRPPLGATLPVPRPHPELAPGTLFPPWPARVWPDHQVVAGRLALAGPVAVGLGGSFVLVGYRVGIATTAVLALSVAVALARRWRPATGRSTTILAVAIGLGLSTSMTSTDAGWLHWLVVITIVAVAIMAATRVGRWRGLVVALAVPVLALGRGARWTGRGCAALRGPRRPINDDPDPGRPLGRSRGAWVAALTLSLVVIFGALFVSADSAFAHLAGDLVPRIGLDTLTARVATFVALTVLLLTLGYLRDEPPAFDAIDLTTPRPGPRWEWIAPLLALDLLFASFVLVQLTVLFGGRQHVVSTGQLTFAEYARQGFWQLLVVSLLTLVVIAAAIHRIDRTDPVSRSWARVLLGLLGTLSLVIVASALRRMALYEQTYGVTRLRLGATVIEYGLGAVFVLLLLAGVRLQADWLPRAAFGVGLVAVITLSVIQPDEYLARADVHRYERTGRIDAHYLSSLSADAVPALDRLPEPIRSCALAPIAARLGRPDAVLDWNRARSTARSLLERHPIDPAARC